MTDYRITWTIDVGADSPEAAAAIALEIMRDPSSTATTFEVVANDARETVDADPS